MNPDAPTPQVTHDSERQRYEVSVGAEVAGFAAYQEAKDLVVFTHTEVEPRFEGRGLGSQLVRHALDDVRRRGLPVLPICPFVDQWIKRHPDYHDLDYRHRPSQ